MAQTGITTGVLRGENAPQGYKAANLAQDSLPQDQGYLGAEGLQVEHVQNGGEVTRTLPRNLEVSPLDMPKHAPGTGNRSTRSQKPASPGRVPTGRVQGKGQAR